VTKHLQTLAFVFAFALASTAIASTQEKEKPTPPPPQKASTPMPLNVTPLKVQVVFARYQGEKKISSMPYTLTMNANNHANLRMGTKIPIVTMTFANMPKDSPQAGSVNYQDVGLSGRAAGRRREGQPVVPLVPRDQHDGAAQRRDRPVHDGDRQDHRRNSEGRRHADGGEVIALDVSERELSSRAR
jgi:hypothetical protein